MPYKDQHQLWNEHYADWQPVNKWLTADIAIPLEGLYSRGQSKARTEQQDLPEDFRSSRFKDNVKEYTKQKVVELQLLCTDRNIAWTEFRRTKVKAEYAEALAKWDEEHPPRPKKRARDETGETLAGDQGIASEVLSPPPRNNLKSAFRPVLSDQATYLEHRSLQDPQLYNLECCQIAGVS